MTLDPWRPSLTPRAWQQAALSAWEGAGRHGIVRVVTGAGKTAFAELAMTRFRDGQQTPSPIVVIVPTLALMDQWYVSLVEDLGVSGSHIATYSGDGRSPNWREVNLVVLNTARSISRSIPSRGAFLIVDECHRAASPENRRALVGQYLATLGMSATPEREYDDWFTDVLIPRLGRIIFEYDYLTAIRDGVLSPFDLINVAVDLLPRERLEYDRLTRGIARALQSSTGLPGDPSAEALLRRRAGVSARASMRVPTAVRIIEEHRGERAIVFHERIEAASAIHRLLLSRGMSAAMYHSGIDPTVRRDNLRLFRRGVFDVLVTCRALDEGINIPETRVGVIASSTASNRQRIQRLGRLLRPSPGKQRAVVYTIYATGPEERRLLQEASSDSGAGSISWRRATFLAQGKSADV